MTIKIVDEIQVGPGVIIPHIIRVEAGKQYLSEVFKDGFLPYGILNKSNPGCGGTTVALESPYDYIVFVPTIELIRNKCSQYNNEDGPKRCRFQHYEYEVEIQSVYGDFSTNKEEIDCYIRDARANSNPIKIMATYDSAKRLFDYLGESIVKNCYILVDEFHSLMIDYNYRFKAIEDLIEATSEHPKVTYMSATPLKPEQGPIQLEKFPITIIKWANDGKPYVALQYSKSPMNSVKAIIVQDFAGRPVLRIFDRQDQPIFPEQYFFFINNVKHIKNIILDLPDSIRNQMCIVCTYNEGNSETLGELVNLVGSTSSLNRYNFLTKRAFYGCDIYSKNGLSIVVTNVKIDVMLLDINTDIVQISGRIRNVENPFKDVLVHIYNRRPEDETLQEINRLAHKYQASETYNNPNNANHLRHELFRSSLRSDTYNSLKVAYDNADMKSYEIDLKFSIDNELTQYFTGRFDENLGKICTLYYQGECEDDLPEQLKLFLLVHPIVKEAIDTLGVDKLQSFRFREKEICKALEKIRRKEALKPQVITMLKENITVGEIYPLYWLKSLIAKIYKSLEIEENATASHIKRYYSVKITSILIDQNTIKTKGAFKILASIV